MKAAVLSFPGKIAGRPLRIEEVARPEPSTGQVLLRVLACGVCRTDLHIVEGELLALHAGLIPGHQIVGEILGTAAPELPVGTRVGVSWIGGTDGTCWYCRNHFENLCDRPTFTGYTVNGGYAEFAVARADFIFPLPNALDALHAAPLLCAGIIGFRSLRVAGVQPGSKWDSSVLALRRISPSKCCAPGGARFTFQRAGNPIASSPSPWERNGWDRRCRSRRLNWIEPSPLRPAGTWWLRRFPACARVEW